VNLAKAAFFGIRFNTVETMGDRDPLWISVTLPPDYDEKNRFWPLNSWYEPQCDWRNSWIVSDGHSRRQTDPRANKKSARQFKKIYFSRDDMNCFV
jgi:hypothetical protein